MSALAYFDEQPRIAALLDTKGQITRVSARFRSAMGLSTEAPLGFGLETFVDEGSRDALKAALDALHEPGSRESVSLSSKALVEGAAPLVFRWEFSRSLGHDVIFAVASEPSVSVGRPGGLRDSEMAFRHDFLAQVIDHMPVVVWAVDERGIFTLSDGSALASLGLVPGQVVGMDAFQVYAGDPEVIRRMREALDGVFSHNFTHVGGRHWENRFVPIRRDDGTVEGLFGFSLDVTERMETERELRQKLLLIEEQESAIRTLSTPIMRVWAGVLALPLVGMLDASRIERILSALLESVVSEQAEYVILDMTGIETVDDTTADHVFKVLRALALLGTQAVVTGVQPGVARALVEIGVNLIDVVTLGNLEEAIRFVMKRRAKVGKQRSA